MPETILNNQHTADNQFVGGGYPEVANITLADTDWLEIIPMAGTNQMMLVSTLAFEFSHLNTGVSFPVFANTYFPLLCGDLRGSKKFYVKGTAGQVIKINFTMLGVL